MNKSLIFGLALFVTIVSCISCTRYAAEVVERPGEPSVYAVNGEDREMNLAITEARETVGDFIYALQNPNDKQTDFSIKCEFSDGEKVEHMWLGNVSFDGKMFHGEIANEPLNLTNISLGDQVTVLPTEISDWMIIEDNRLVGGYTIYVLRKMMTPEEREKLDKSISFVMEPFDWTRTIDHFYPETRVYYNRSIPMKLTLPVDWKVFVKPETSKVTQASTVKREKEEGIEFALFAHHPFALVGVVIYVEKAAAIEKDFSPAEYIAAIKEIHEDDYKGCKDLALVEKDVKGLRAAEWKYVLVKKTKVTYRELVFLLNDYAVRVCCYSPSHIYHKFEHKCEEILESISVK